MGSKSTRLNSERGIRIPIDDPPVSLSSPEGGVYFGLKGSIKPCAALGVLDSLYHIPCMCECLLSGQIDSSCHASDKVAIYELQAIFDARARAPPGTLVSCDQFVKILAASAKLDIKTEEFDENDPTHIYRSIICLICRSLPDLRSIFLDVLLRDQLPGPKKYFGICVTLIPDIALSLDDAIREQLTHGKVKISEPSPVFTVTTNCAIHPKGKPAPYNLIFPRQINLSKFSSANSTSGRAEMGLVYELQAVLVETMNDNNEVEDVCSYFRSGMDMSWFCNMGSGIVKTKPDKILQLGTSKAKNHPRVRNLIYIQSDLPRNLVDALKAAYDSSNGEKISLKNSGTKEIKEKNNPIGPVPMDEDTNDEEYENGEDDEDEEYDDDDDDDDDGEEEYDEGDDEDEYEEERTAMCQCPTCRRERENHLREQEKIRMEKEAAERIRKENLRKQLIPKTPGTRSVLFQSTVLEGVERIIKDGKVYYRDNFLQTITAMEGYSRKSTEELRFEDYCADSPALKAVKQSLDAEVIDRIREAAARRAMENDENSMRKWSQAADRAWNKYEKALETYKENLFEQAFELFSQALKMCHTGSHCVGCHYYRAVSVSSYGGDNEQIVTDCEAAIALEPKYANAHYLLGSTCLKIGKDFEKADFHLEKAHSLDISIFEGNTERLRELEVVKEKAANQRLENAAEVKKIAGNAAMARGAYVEAERLYSEAIKLCPNGNKSHIYYCNRAAARCEIAMRLDSNPQDSHATILSAVEDCDKSLTFQANYPKALFRKAFCSGVAAFLNENLEESLSHFTMALELDPTNTIVQQELRKVQTSIEVIKAKEKAIDIEREMVEREVQRAAEKEREKKLLEEKKARDDQIRKEKAEKLEQEKIERARLKAERESVKAEKEKALAEEREKEKERLRAEKEKEKLAREQEKIEERERKRADKEKEKERLKSDKERREREISEAQRKERERKLEFSKEMDKVKAVINAPKTQSIPTVSSVTVTTAPIKESLKLSPEIVPIKEEIIETAREETNDVPESPELNPFNEYSDDQDEESKAPPEEETKVVEAPVEPVKKQVKTTSVGSILSALNPLGLIGKSVKKEPKADTAATAAADAAKLASAKLAEEAAKKNEVVTRYMKCPLARVGSVIGAKGSIIGEIMKRTNAKVSINQDYPEGHPRKVVLVGTQEQIDQAKILVEVVIIHGPLALNQPELIAEVEASMKGTPTTSSSEPKQPIRGVSPTNELNLVPRWGANTINPVEIKDYDEKICMFCNESQREGQRIPSFGPCNHKGICSICMIRSRGLKKDLSCPVCDQHLEAVVCTLSDLPYVDIILPGNLSDDLIFFQEASLYCPRNYFKTVVYPLFKTDFQTQQRTEQLTQASNSISPSISNLPESTIVEQKLPEIDLSSTFSSFGSSLFGSSSDPILQATDFSPEVSKLLPEQTLTSNFSSLGLGSSTLGAGATGLGSSTLGATLGSSALSGSSALGSSSLFDSHSLLSGSSDINQSFSAGSGIMPTSSRWESRFFSNISNDGLNPLSDDPTNSRSDFPLYSSSRSSSLLDSVNDFGVSNTSKLSSSILKDDSISSMNINGLGLNMGLNSILPPSSGSQLGGLNSLQGGILGNAGSNIDKVPLSLFQSSTSSSLNSVPLNNDNFFSNSNPFSSMSSFGSSYPFADNSSLLGSNLEPDDVPLTLAAYQSGVLSRTKLARLCESACIQYHLDNQCKEYFNTSSDEKKLTVLISLREKTPGSRIDDSSFVKNAFQMQNDLSRNLMMDNSKDLFGSSNSMFFSDLIKPSQSSSMAMDPLLSSRTLTIPAHDISPAAPPFTGLGLNMSPLTSSLDGPNLPTVGRLPQSSLNMGSSSLGINPSLNAPPLPNPTNTLDFTTLQDDCSDFPPEVTERLIEVIKRYPDGILGSQLPEAYRKIFGDKLMLETVKGRKIKLMNILDGHPNARKDTSGILKWFFVPTPPGQAPAAQIKSAWSNPNRADKSFASQGIEQDLLGPEAFPSVAWMRDYGMHLYRWAGNESEWTEFALRLRPEMASILDSEGEGGLASLRRKSGCDVSISTEKLRGKQEKFCVLVRGETGAKSNGSMTLALELIAQQFRDLIKLTNLDKDETKDDDFSDLSESRGERSNDGRIHRTMELTPYAVSILTGKNNKKLNILRKKSGAYVNIIPPKVVKGTKSSSKLAVSGTAANIEIALTMATSFTNSTVVDGNEK